MANTADVFELRHQQEYALEIVARDPADENTVVAVRCLFCVHLGREPAPDGALRQRSQNVRAWRTFHPINFQRHHEGQHAAHWKLYQACTPAEKDGFFEKHKKDDQQVSSAPASASTGVAAGVAGGVAGGGASVTPVKRPRGRPRSNGAASIQWSDEMAQRLLQLRFETYGNWFSSGGRTSKHDGWKLITSTLTDEFGMTVDSEQCKNKLRLLKAATHKQELGPDARVAATRPRRAVTVPSAVVSADENREVGGVSADVPVKRGRGRPRRDATPVATSYALSPQKKQRLENEVSGASGGDVNTALLRSILRSTEEQRDALLAQRAAAEAQTASIQELLQLLKARVGEPPKLVVTASELV